MSLSFLETTVENEELVLGLDAMLNHDVLRLLTDLIPNIEKQASNAPALDEYELAMT
ncbi:MAG: hypothetical protein GQ569_03645 [Methylococcaceae bacterium]|nr:hypothetical protein [Methylococcaceae bacterium]